MPRIVKKELMTEKVKRTERFYEGRGRHTLRELEIMLELTLQNGKAARKMQEELLTVLSELESASHAYVNGEEAEKSLIEFEKAHISAIDIIKRFKDPQAWALEKVHALMENDGNG